MRVVYFSVLSMAESEFMNNMINAEHPDVISVFLNKGKRLHTTHSWSFLGLERDGEIPFASIWYRAKFGKDVIIGNLDTGEFYIFQFLRKGSEFRLLK